MLTLPGNEATASGWWRYHARLMWILRRGRWRYFGRLIATLFMVDIEVGKETASGWWELRGRLMPIVLEVDVGWLWWGSQGEGRGVGREGRREGGGGKEPPLSLAYFLNAKVRICGFGDFRGGFQLVLNSPSDGPGREYWGILLQGM